MLRAKYWLVEY